MVVVVILVLGSLLALGVFSPKSSGSGPATFDQANGATNAFMSGYKGGGWRAIYAEGLVSRTSVASNASSLSSLGSLGSIPGCTSTDLLANGTALTLPADTLAISSGAASGWLFADVNSSGGIALVQDLGSSIAVDFLISCSGFVGNELGLLPGIPTGTIDSSTAVGHLLGLPGAAAFVAAHPNLTASYAIGVSTSSASLFATDAWTITLQACAISTGSTSAVVPTYGGNVGAINGTVYGAGGSNQSCGSSFSSGSSTGASTPLGSVLSLGTMVAGTTTTNASGSSAPVCSTQQPCSTYTTPVTFAGSGLVWSDVGLKVLAANGTTLSEPSNWTWDIVSVSGTAAATATGGVWSGWAGSGGSATVSSGENIVLTVPAGAGLSAGDLLEAFAFHPLYSGTVSSFFP